MMLVVTLKYVTVIMRADNRGEGGILALMAVVQRSLPIASPLTYGIGMLGIFGTALFFGDGVITPAISVLSAVEGLEVAAPALQPLRRADHRWLVLLALFAFQRHGTEQVGKMFGPVMVAVVPGPGAARRRSQVLKNPRCCRRSIPVWRVQFFMHHGVHAWLALGAVVLAVTGGEALYADMGHFGRQPIRIAWMGFVDAGAGAELLRPGRAAAADPAAVANPFYSMVPDWALFPMIVLATMADGDRLAGGDLGRVLAGAPGHATGLPAAPAAGAHLGGHHRPGLRALGQSRPAGAGDDPGGGFQTSEQPGRRPTASR